MRSPAAAVALRSLATLGAVVLLLLLLGATWLWRPASGPLPGLSRPKRAALTAPVPIADDERRALTEYHNRLRASVHPQAADMEHMSWDWKLAEMAEAWAKQCKWGHGPSDEIDAIGQNLAVYVGSDRPLAYHVQAWFDEEEWYQYPEEKECSPECPHTCRGPICTHYTQLVWAESSRVGCAAHTCLDISVWDSVWPYALYLVCNYSPKGNWIGEAPYRQGTPCSRCPPRFGGSCRGGLCYQAPNTTAQNWDLDETQLGERRPKIPLIETPRAPVLIPGPNRSLEFRNRELTKPRNQAIAKAIGRRVTCRAKMREVCKGFASFRFLCPENCSQSTANVIGTHVYDVESGLCRSARHTGALGPGGGWIDVKRRGRTHTFNGSTRNGVRSLGKRRPANSFSVSASPVREVSCKDTLRDICPLKFPPPPRCPRFVCPPRCTQAHGIVVGTGIYSDTSSVCLAAVHAGAVTAQGGGRVDVVPAQQRKVFNASLRHGLRSFGWVSAFVKAELAGKAPTVGHVVLLRRGTRTEAARAFYVFRVL
ncbi:unnamed protein product [Lampetra fluviatilis]